MLNNYKHNLLKRVDTMTNEEVFDAIAGPEKRIKYIRRDTIFSNLILFVAVLPIAVMDDITSVRIFAGVYFALWWITWLLWSGCIDCILQLGERYREIIGNLMEYRNSDGEDWKRGV